jgi:hypothetical protein
MICIGAVWIAIIVCTNQFDRRRRADLVVKAVETKAAVHMLSTMLLTYHSRFGRVPSSLEELHLMLRDVGEQVPSVLEDEWGRAFVLRVSEVDDHRLGADPYKNIEIISFGADGVVGGEGIDQDIVANVKIINGVAVGEL